MIPKDLRRNSLREDWFMLGLLLTFTFLLLFFCSKMSPLYPINEWSDINLYFNLGKAMFNGKTIYAEAFDHKGPLIFFIYGIGYLISGTSFLGVFIIQFVAWAVMCIYIYRTAGMFLDKPYSMLVSLLMLIMLLTKTQQGGSAEEFVLVSEIVSLFYFVKYFNQQGNTPHPAKWMLIHGAMFSITFFIKLNLVTFWFFPVVFIGLNLLINREYGNFFRNVLYFLLGVAIVALPILLYFIINGALGVAYDTYISLNLVYSQVASLGRTLELLAIRFYQQYRFDFVNFFIASIGTVIFSLLCIRKWIFRTALILAFLSSYIAVFNGQGYVQYYSLAYYAFIATGLIGIFYWVEKYITIVYAKRVCLLLMICILFLGINKKDFFGMTREQLLREEVPEDLNKRFGAIIAEEKNPTLMNVNNDNGNVLFTSQNIMPNVRYFITPNIAYELYDEMKQAQMGYVRDGKIQFIVLNDRSMNYRFIVGMPEFHEQYQRMDSVPSSFGNYYLYKRKY
ncbi:glycosyltransferase family 39 protein [Dysgonomonas sp. 25]|uniref:ArnT family glycosyltransferase n=1 Tax=Dysgonomonas sp. 25 TaxID=2302933 RepID=UPI0013D3B0F9|nr:glycosyltransferase family 39 protein [Dysgonomonas sp. 25]NDV68999.1 hypothetical protein [Dysgonomonas sp. 25]